MSRVCFVSTKLYQRRVGHKTAPTLCISTRRVDSAPSSSSERRPPTVQSSHTADVKLNDEEIISKAAGPIFPNPQREKISCAKPIATKRKRKHKRIKAKRKKDPKWLPLFPEDIGMSWGCNAARSHALKAFDSDVVAEEISTRSPKTISDACYRHYEVIESLCAVADHFEEALDLHRSRVGQHLRPKKKWSRQKTRIAVKDFHAKDFNVEHGAKVFIKARVFQQLRERIDEKKTDIRSSHLRNPASIPKSSVPPVTNTKTKVVFKKPSVAQTPAPVMAAHQLVSCNIPTDLDQATANLLISLQHREITPEDYELLLQLDESVANKTVSESAVAALRTCPAEGAKVGELCPICLIIVEPGVILKFLPCDHCFHEECIDRWLTYSSRNCPLDGLPVDA